MSRQPTVNTKAKDWHSSKHIRKRVRYLLEHLDEEIPSDVTFLVGDGNTEPQKTFRCHKFILAMVSSMFQAMFYGSFPQTQDTIKIPDVTPAAFQNMLRYAYGERVTFGAECVEEALDTLYCAKKYLIDKLARSCRDDIQFQIVELERDACAVFQMALQMGEEDLATLALTRIAMNGSAAAFIRDGILCVSFDCLKRIVDYPHHYANETDIYIAVRRWVEHNMGYARGSALRNAFGSLLYSIRFPLFSATELADGPVADGLLTGDEVTSLFQFLFSKVKPALPFLTTQRTHLAETFLWQLCSFTLVTVPAGAPVISRNQLCLRAYPDLAPDCWEFLRRLISSNSHIRIASFDNEHLGKTMPLPAAVQSERNMLVHGRNGFCWFEWDMDGGAAVNVRLGTARKPHPHHSAVFGFVSTSGKEIEMVPVDLWDDRRILSVADFLIDTIE